MTFDLSRVGRKQKEENINKDGGLLNRNNRTYFYGFRFNNTPYNKFHYQIVMIVL